MKLQHETDFPTKEYLVINSCGSITHISADSHIDRPYRTDYQLMYVAEGKVEVDCGDKILWANKGDIIFYRPGEPQTYSLYEKFKSSTFWVHFGGTGADNLVKSLNLENKTIFPLAHKREIEEHLHRLVETYSIANPHYQMLCNGILLSILALFGRYSSSVSKKAETLEEKYSSEIINELISTFRIHGFWMSVEDCANYCNLSTPHFSRTFKRVTGQSPNKFFNNVRIDYSKKLLLYTNYPVFKISEMAGFNDQNYFARIFKKTTGVTPLQFRKQ